MQIKRKFTDGQTDPFDTVEWERRKSEIRDTNGAIVYSEDSVEVPIFWSQVATDIVASKYFKRAGVPSKTVPVEEDGIIPRFYRSIAAEDADFGRETSVKQCVHRIVGTWTYWSIKLGYLSTEEDAIAFYDEMVYSIIHQYLSPNSPQWFNTGLGWAYGIAHKDDEYYFADENGNIFDAINDENGGICKQQLNACFILPVEDKMFGKDSIYDSLVSETKIFKRGSGSGSDFSLLRGEGEPLSSGGTSSGLMSFLRIYDRNADAVKSGGLTRRAAKLVVVDASHPDIEKFVDWKFIEEQKVTSMITGSSINNKILNEIMKRCNELNIKDSQDVDEIIKDIELQKLFIKARNHFIEPNYVFRAIALAKQGYTDMPFIEMNNDFNGEAYHTVSGQNSNNSVAITDEFLDAVRRQGPWNLISRFNGKILKTIQAKDLWDKISYAAWSCADPGIQFRTTINAWNTCKNDGDIVSSNPCVTGDTLISTSSGLQRIADIVGSSIEIFSAGGKLRKVSRIIKTGKKDVYCITTASGYSLLATEDHLILTNHGDVAVKDLTSKHELLLGPVGFGDISLDNEQAFALGISAIGVHPNNISIEISNSISSYIMDEGCNRKRFADKIFSLNRDSIKTIIRGIFTDVDYKDKSQYISLESSSKDLLRQVQILLLGFGIKSKINNLLSDHYSLQEHLNKDMHSLRISRSSRTIFEKEIGLSDRNVKLYTTSEYKDKMSDRVKNVEYVGKEDVYDLTEPIEGHFVANGIVVHNCSEYFFLNNTCCNLLSMRISKFYNSSRQKFDTKKMEHVCRLSTLALEASVEASLVATKDLALGNYNYRPVGLGYADIGSLLMSMGIPYDSDEALGWIGCLTSMMTGAAYLTSAEMAEEKGPFPRYEHNKDSMLCVIRNHRRACYDVDETEFEKLNVKPMAIDADKAPKYILDTCKKIWDAVLENGQKYGFRNAQVTVIAPTGTIGLQMDVDTTGIEPDYSLVKFKKLAGGGYIKIVNDSVSSALRTLGYSIDQVDEVIRYITGSGCFNGCPTINCKSLLERGVPQSIIDVIDKQLLSAFDISFVFNKYTLGEDFCQNVLSLTEDQMNDVHFSYLKAMGYTDDEISIANDYICGKHTVENAPYIKQEHYSIFDCAGKCGKYGTRQIHHFAHIKAMASAQAFISGAISKTINLAKDSTVSDVQSCYMMAHELGLKGVALYRDMSKLSQPLSSSIGGDAYDDIIDTAIMDLDPINNINEPLSRKRLSKKRFSITHEFSIGGSPDGSKKGCKIFFTISEYDDRTPGEIFIHFPDENSFARTSVDIIARLLSLCMQFKVPLEEITDVLRSPIQEPKGFVDHPNIWHAKSPFDVIGKTLAGTYLNDIDAFDDFPAGDSYENMGNISFVSKASTPIVERKELVSDKNDNKKNISFLQCEKCGSFDMVSINSCTKKCSICGTVSGSCSE